MSVVAEAPAGKQAEVKREVVLEPARIQLAEYARQDWIVTAEEGTDPADIVKPSYWTHCAAQMKLYDEATVRVETGEWIMRVVVVEANRNWVRVVPLELYDLIRLGRQRFGGEAPPPAETLYSVFFKGPVRKWEVARISDGHVMHSGMAEKHEAETWLRQYERQTG